MTTKMTTLLVFEKSIGPVGFGIPCCAWEYDMNGIKRNAKRKLEVVEIYLLKFFIVIDLGFYFFIKLHGILNCLTSCSLR